MSAREVVGRGLSRAGLLLAGAGAAVTQGRPRRVVAPPQAAGVDVPAPVSAELNRELARLARGVLAIGRLYGDLSLERQVVEVRRQLHAVAVEHDHPDLVPLLLLRVAEYAQYLIDEQGRS